VHPQPGLERFGDFEMPRDLVEGKGYPELTPTIKEKILGGNIARLHGLDLAGIRDGIAGDRFDERSRDGLAPPWSGIRERLGAVT
jgi:uncharacterized protein